jgi:hypothetical protein
MGAWDHLSAANASGLLPSTCHDLTPVGSPRFAKKNRCPAVAARRPAVKNLALTQNERGIIEPNEIREPSLPAPKQDLRLAPWPDQNFSCLQDVFAV